MQLITTETTTPEKPTSRTTSFITFYFVYILMLALPAAASTWLIFSWVPACREVFKDFKTVLPTSTENLLSFTDWAGQSYVWPFLLLAFLLLPFLLTALTLRFNATPQRLCVTMIVMMVTFFFTITGWFFVQTAMFMPMVKLIQSVSGGEGPSP